MIRALVFWTVGAILILFALAWTGACSGAQKTAAPAQRVDEMSWCYAAIVAGTETIGCAEDPKMCEAARLAATPAASEVSEQCYQVQLRLDRANP